MRYSANRLALALALLVVPLWAQEIPPETGSTAPRKKRVQNKKKNNGNVPAQAPADDGKEAAAGEGGGDDSRVVGRENEDNELVKTLKPKDVPAELLRLRSKADIKAEVTVQPLHGRASTFKGVIRNGKLIERFVGRRFVPQEGIDHSRAGVRLWWVGGTDGWIFFRYSAIKSLSLTGKLTLEERREIIRRLKAKREGEERVKQAQQTAALESQLEKMSEVELERFLLANYPEDDGWHHQRLRELKKKQIIDNLPVSREEAVFVRYFQTLTRARLKELKRTKRKVKIEPGSEKENDAERRFVEHEVDDDVDDRAVDDDE